MKEEIIVQVDAVSLIKTAKKANSWQSVISHATNGENTQIVRCVNDKTIIEETHSMGQTSKFRLKIKE